MLFRSLYEGHITITNKNIKRPILSVRDLARAVEKLITNKASSNIYNLASFNSTVDSISKIVGEYTKVDIIDKGNTTGTYNFAIDNAKFKNLNSFMFEDNIHSTVENVIECYKNKNPKIVARNEYFQYD